MIAYKKKYLQFYGYGEQDFIICRGCLKRRAVDIHHIKARSLGGSDEVINLIAVCRYCHDEADKDTVFNTRLKEISIRMHRAWSNSTGG